MSLPAIRQEPWFDNAAYPFTSRFLDVGVGRMHYVDEGSGDVLLMVHGTPSWSFEFRQLIADLRSRWRVVAPDLLGFGLSDKPQSFGYRLADHTRALEEFVAKLGLTRFRLLVHDFGGPVGLPLALEQPRRVEKLVILNSWLWALDSVDKAVAGQKRILGSGLMRWLYQRHNFSARVIVKSAWGRHRALSKSVHAHYTNMFPTPADRVGTLGFLRSVVEEGPYLDALWQRRAALEDIPKLLIWGLADGFVKPVHLAHWKNAFPSLRVEELTHVGHFPADEAGELVTPLVRAFLQDSTA
ncbi:MAG: alpha/beta fold hydrolase [Myxococcota bacterium]